LEVKRTHAAGNAGDLDGLTSAVIITLKEPIDEIALVHPQDITDKKSQSARTTSWQTCPMTLAAAFGSIITC